jgi:CheY-specific phosphatase CheX
MSTPLNVEVINVFTSSLHTVFEAATGVSGRLGPLKIVTELPPPPHVMVTIHVSGKLVGPAMWIFEPQVARELAARMLASEETPAFDSPECRDALGELANILVGNVTGALLDAGYPIELSPPTTEMAPVAEKLDGQNLRLSFDTNAGKVDLFLGLSLV